MHSNPFTCNRLRRPRTTEVKRARTIHYFRTRSNGELVFNGLSGRSNSTPIARAKRNYATNIPELQAGKRLFLANSLANGTEEAFGAAPRVSVQLFDAWGVVSLSCRNCQGRAARGGQKTPAGKS